VPINQGDRLIFSPQKTPARYIALLGTILLLSLTAVALGRQTQQQPQQTPQQPAPPPPYKDSFPVTHTQTSQQSQPQGAPAPYKGSFPVTHTNPTPSATTPAPKPQTLTKTPAERVHNAIVSLPPLAFHPTTIVIDPAHGGADNGSRISDTIVEKDVTLALAFRLRSLLAARGFNVVLTRQDDKAANTAPPFAPLTLDDRAGIANHERASACIFLHATSSGSGVHLYTSELTPAPGELSAAPWLTLQAPWVTESQQLAGRIADALNRSHIQLVNGYASIRPVDSTACPALVFELAPHTDDPDSINDTDYQQSVAQATANALILWKDAAKPPPQLAPPAPPSTEATTPEATTP
jgi:N-acetylmuramoyl-L-alanine amidase